MGIRGRAKTQRDFGKLFRHYRDVLDRCGAENNCDTCPLLKKCRASYDRATGIVGERGLTDKEFEFFLQSVKRFREILEVSRDAAAKDLRYAPDGASREDGNHDEAQYRIPRTLQEDIVPQQQPR